MLLTILFAVLIKKRVPFLIGRVISSWSQEMPHRYRKIFGVPDDEDGL